MSTLEVSNLNDGTTTVATTYVTNGSAKAWVNFQGDGTVAIRDSLNTSSITDTTTGQYFQNYTSNMNAVDYCSVGSAGKSSGGHTESNSGYVNLAEISGTYVNKRTIFVCTVAGDFVDRDHVTCMIIGDLA